MNTKNIDRFITHDIDESKNTITLRSSDTLKNHSPMIGEFIDGIEIDLEKLLEFDMW